MCDLKYNVNTMTITSNLGIPVCLNNVIECMEKSIINTNHEDETQAAIPHQVAWRNRATSCNERFGKPVIKKNGFKKVFKKRLFDNQVTVIFKTTGDNFVNMKVFASGKTQMTGVKSLESAECCMEKLTSILRIPNKHINTKVHLMNADVSFNVPVDRELLYKKIREEYGIVVSFQPEIHPSVKIGYYTNPSGTGKCQKDVQCDGKEKDCCKKVTTMVFHTGKIIVTGANKTSQIDQALNFVASVLRSM
jgi:TATA-box binding protein (TBP) (component of TFIID and TFIIIB)